MANNHKLEDAELYKLYEGVLGVWQDFLQNRLVGSGMSNEEASVYSKDLRLRFNRLLLVMVILELRHPKMRHEIEVVLENLETFSAYNTDTIARQTAILDALFPVGPNEPA